MTSQMRHILEQALTLSPAERAELVEQILSSLESPDREAIDNWWAKEAEARIEAFERGEIKAAPAAEVFGRIDRQQDE